jgi:hypothetical protein
MDKGSSQMKRVCCDKIELTRLLFYSDIQFIFIGAIGPFATLAYQASRAFQSLPLATLPRCHGLRHRFPTESFLGADHLTGFRRVNLLLFIGVANATSGVEGPGRLWKALISQHL